MKKIGIIGAGQIGGTLTRRLTALGYKVFVANSRGPDSLTELAKETGATPATTEDAARSGDFVVLTIPMKNIPDLPKDLFKNIPKEVIVIDTCNYYPRQRDGRIEAIEAGLTESQWVSQQIGRSVIKVFNNIFAEHILKLGRPNGDSERIALPIAGDDERAKKLVFRLVDELGFDPIDDGHLADSWRQQPGTPVYTKDYSAEAVVRGLKEAKKERSPDWMSTGKSPTGFAA